MQIVTWLSRVIFTKIITRRYIEMYFVYILQSLKNNSLYIGYTTDIKKRLERHNSGGNKATRPYFPYELIFFEGFQDCRDAKNRERYLKSGWGRRSINKMLKNYLVRC